MRQRIPLTETSLLVDSDGNRWFAWDGIGKGMATVTCEICGRRITQGYMKYDPDGAIPLGHFCRKHVEIRIPSKPTQIVRPA